jgi:hypothetical protein
LNRYALTANRLTTGKAVLKRLLNATYPTEQKVKGNAASAVRKTLFTKRVALLAKIAVFQNADKFIQIIIFVGIKIMLYEEV